MGPGNHDHARPLQKYPRTQRATSSLPAMFQWPGRCISEPILFAPSLSFARPIMNAITSIVAPVAILASISLTSMGQEPSTERYTPKYGYVPNEATAIAIAVAVWIPIYGEGSI